MKVLNRFAASVLMLAIAGPAFAADIVSSKPDNDAAEISALRERLDKLETQQRETFRKAEVTKSVDQVIEDAARRSQMMDIGSLTAGHKDGKFFIGSEDGKFVLKPVFHLQFRHITNRRQDFRNGGANDDTQDGFEVRRMKFGFEGNAFTPELTYHFLWATVRGSGTANVNNAAGTKIGTVSNSLGGAPLLEEAWAKYHFSGTDFSVRAGQIKDPLLHDQVVSSKAQLGVERSITADIFANGDGFTEAVTVIWDPKKEIRAEAGFTHGMRSANTNYLDFPNTNAYNYGFVARGEYKLMGNWKDYTQMTAVGVKDQLLVVGLGADYSERGDSSQVVAALDVSYASPNGLSAYAAFVDRYTTHNFGIYNGSSTGASIGTPDPAIAGRSTNEYSLVAQVGYLMKNNIEPYGRFEYMRLQGTAAGSRNYVTAITAGANYYLYGNGCKVTAQITYLPNGIPIDDGGSDILASPAGNGEVVGSIQFQLAL